MKTLSKSQRLLYAVNSDTMPGVPKGKVHVYLVQFEHLEFDDGDFDQTKFEIININSKEVQTIVKSAAPSYDRERVADELDAEAKRLEGEGMEETNIQRPKQSALAYIQASAMNLAAAFLRRK